jgi:hypothetical protein
MHAAAFTASPQTEEMFELLHLSSSRCCLFSLSHGGQRHLPLLLHVDNLFVIWATKSCRLSATA